MSLCDNLSECGAPAPISSANSITSISKYQHGAQLNFAINTLLFTSISTFIASIIDSISSYTDYQTNR